MTPSVTLKVNIPESLEGSFYQGNVFIGLKENCFEQSTCLRHLVEFDFVDSEGKPIECHYHDGGSGHNVRHMRKKLAMIAYFLKRDLDFLLSVQTPPQHSWKNPVERVMSLLNIAMQGLRLMREECSTCEGLLNTVSSMESIRGLTTSHPKMKDEVIESTKQAKELLKNSFSQLRLKDEPFSTIEAASEEKLLKFAQLLNKIDESFDPMILIDSSKPTDIGDKLKSFMSTHCHERHYMFSVKRCGLDDCVCGKVRLSNDIMKTVHHLSDLIPSLFDSDKFKRFDDAYGILHREGEPDKYMPSQVQPHKDNGMPFAPSAQVANCTKLVAQCTDCERWRFIYASKGISKEERNIAQRLFEDVFYSCGASIQDIEVGEDEENEVLKKLFTSTKLTCILPMEIPYYSAFSNEPLCFHCGKCTNLVALDDKKYFPLCAECERCKKPERRQRVSKGKR